MALRSSKIIDASGESLRTIENGTNDLGILSVESRVGVGIASIADSQR